VQHVFLLVSFVGVLWGLSRKVTFEFRGVEWAIPGYMVWCALAYALVGSLLTWWVGRPLIELNAERYAREAELRFALMRVSERAEAIALYGGEADERRTLDRSVARMLAAVRRLAFGLARLTWITSGYGWLALVVPIVVALPGYFAGGLTLGGLMMVVGAFQQVQEALRWFVDNVARIADWRAALHRVMIFRDALHVLDEVEDDSERIEVADHPAGLLAFEGVSVLLGDGRVVIAEATATIQAGERVLLVGESGSGKSTLFRAIAGLWPWGSGRILLPKRSDMMFMPQRPYLPLGTLRAAVTYPEPPGAFGDAAVRAAVDRVGLGDLLPQLDREERWDRALSMGEQQRLAFARLVLHAPKWVFLDEATSALDRDSEARVMAMFDEELAGATLLSIGHRRSLEAFHHRALQLLPSPEGAKLRRRPRNQSGRRSLRARLWSPFARRRPPADRGAR
jgi:putative ATP-binding cassette transporter